MTGKPRVLMVGRTRYRLPLSPPLRRKFDALAEEVDVRVLASGSARAGEDPRFVLVPPAKGLDGALFWAALPARIAREVRRFRPDAILAQSPYEAAAAVAALRLARVNARVLVDVHGDWRTSTRLYGSPLRRLLGPAADRVALVSENTLFGTGAADAEEAEAKKYSYDLALRMPYAANASEVQSEVQKVKAANADVIFQASYLNDALLFMKTYKQQRLNVQGILAQDAGFIDPNFVKNLGKDADYVLTRDVFSLNIKHRNKGVPLINELFKQRSGGNNLDGNTARDFTAVTVIADAIDRAGSTKPAAIAKALRETKIDGKRTIVPWRGIKFDEKGQNTLGNGIIEQIQGGAYETVWPFDVATKPAIWPMPAWDKR
jgi:hypothetical protein